MRGAQRHRRSKDLSQYNGLSQSHPCAQSGTKLRVECARPVEVPVGWALVDAPPLAREQR